MTGNGYVSNSTPWWASDEQHAAQTIRDLESRPIVVGGWERDREPTVSEINETIRRQLADIERGDGTVTFGPITLAVIKRLAPHLRGRIYDEVQPNRRKITVDNPEAEQRPWLGLDDMADIKPGDRVESIRYGIKMSGTAHHYTKGVWYTEESGALIIANAGAVWRFAD